VNRLTWKKIAPAGESYHVGRVEMRGRNACHVHSHDFAEVFWIENGDGLHDINGQHLPIKRGTFVFVRPDDCHGFRGPTKAGFTLVNVAFPFDTIAFLRTRYFSHETRFFWTKTSHPYQLELNASQLAWLQGWADNLGRAPRNRLEIERFLIELLHEFGTHAARDNAEADPPWLASALKNIRDPDRFGQGTKELARLAGRTRQHVTRTLKLRYDTTATEVVNEARLDHAAMQLRMSTKKIIEISLECGFQNLGHFYQLFRKRFGTTPQRYRLRHHAFLRQNR